MVPSYLSAPSYPEERTPVEKRSNLLLNFPCDSEADWYLIGIPVLATVKMLDIVGLQGDDCTLAKVDVVGSNPITRLRSK
jgi:hypothetical protein